MKCDIGGREERYAVTINRQNWVKEKKRRWNTGQKHKEIGK